MAGDGVSIQTNLAQLSNLARTQSKGQQAGAHGAATAQELKQDDVAPVNKVRETEKTEQDRIDADKERQRRRQKQDDEGDEDDSNEDQPESVGGLVDIKA